MRRKITVYEFMTLDGVMQAPGGPEEDAEHAFAFGGWQAPFDDELAGQFAEKELAEPADYLLGRKTFQIWADYWPTHGDFWPNINSGTKYVLSSTVKETDWANTKFIETVEDIKKLKESDGPDLQVWGSSELMHLLLENDLVDELRLMIYPVILGQGKKVFADGAAPRTFKLVENAVGKSGVFIGRYQRAGDVKTGSMA